MTPTDEQLAIIGEAKASSSSLLISALAGAAKTTTLEMVCKALPVQPILSLAFNKRIAEEMTKRLPGHVKCQTLNSLGHRVWANTCSGRLTLNARKSYELLKQAVDGLKREDRSDMYDCFAETLKAIGAAKLTGFIPDGKFPHATRLVTSDQFFENYFDEDEASPLQREIIESVLTDSIKLAYKGSIDFDDQIYMPTLFGGTFPRFPLVMVDEAQDLSMINHVMLERLVTQRLIAVGDPYQSIYAFRGAVQSGMDRLRSRFAMQDLPLSISFRCPIEVVKLARSRAPHMQWPSWAKPGQVTFKAEWTADEIPESAAIICRNNAPLFACALRLISAGRGVQLVGSDLGPSLVKTLKRLGPENMEQADVYKAIDRWEVERLAKAKAKGAVHDKAECLRVFAGFGTTLRRAIDYAEHLFKSGGPIQLLSGHKAKGLEWNTVYHLDPWRIPSQFADGEEALEQERNVQYVITTRAKESLYHVNLKEFCG